MYLEKILYLTYAEIFMILSYCLQNSFYFEICCLKCSFIAYIFNLIIKLIINQFWSIGKPSFNVFINI